MKIVLACLITLMTINSSLLEASLGKKLKPRDTSKDEIIEILESPKDEDIVRFNLTKKNGFYIPIDLTGESVLIGATIATTLLVFANDEELSIFIQKHNGQIADEVAVFGESFGSDLGFYVGAGAYIYGLVTDNNEIKRFVKIGLEATVITGILNDALKLVFKRALPRDATSVYDISDKTAPTNLAFPSSHAATAFSIATYIAESTKEKSTLIPLLAYSAAAVTAWSRVYQNEHYSSDVIVGALVGHLVTKALMRSKFSKKGLMIIPYFDGHESGVKVHYIFR